MEAFLRDPFQVMIFLIEHVLPRGYFDQSLRALSVDMTVMKDLMLQRVPNTIEHLEYLKNSSGFPHLSVPCWLWSG